MPRPKKSTVERSVHLANILKMMKPLEGLPEFVAFMEEIRQEREAAIADLCNDAVVSDHALTAAAIGEIRTYNSILSLYDARIEQEKAAQGAQFQEIGDTPQAV